MAGRRTNRRGGRNAGAVAVHDMTERDWEGVGKPGLYHKPVREDRAAGHYLGLVRFDPGVRSGLHQHLGIASSYLLAGSLSDYGSTILRGQAGINIRGDTHDAVSYEGCLLAARLEAPVLYPRGGELHNLHSGAYADDFLPVDPEVRPDINITVEEQPAIQTSIAGVSRRTIYDYAHSDDDRRFVQLELQPGARLPPHRVEALTEWFVVAGDIRVGRQSAFGNSFVCLEPGTEVSAASRYGCKLLAWAEGPVSWRKGGRPDLYGFGLAG